MGLHDIPRDLTGRNQCGGVPYLFNRKTGKVLVRFGVVGTNARAKHQISQHITTYHNSTTLADSDPR